MAPKNSIPERWLSYTAVGKPIGNTRFVAFKVPLKQRILEKITPSEWFGPEDLAKQLPKLKLVIDLTNTARYYDGSEIERHGMKYVKLPCVGRELPESSILHRFKHTVSQFLGDSQEPEDTLIGVHCTHGVNRTGYFICRYLIDQLGFKPTEAIDLFNEARGHKMERDVYLNNLRNEETTANGNDNGQPHNSPFARKTQSKYYSNNLSNPGYRNNNNINNGSWRSQNSGPEFNNKLNSGYSRFNNDRNPGPMRSRPTYSGSGAGSNNHYRGYNNNKSEEDVSTNHPGYRDSDMHPGFQNLREDAFNNQSHFDDSRGNTVRPLFNRLERNGFGLSNQNFQNGNQHEFRGSQRNDRSKDNTANFRRAPRRSRFEFQPPFQPDNI